MMEIKKAVTAKVDQINVSDAFSALAAKRWLKLAELDDLNVFFFHVLKLSGTVPCDAFIRLRLYHLCMATAISRQTRCHVCISIN